MTTLPTVVIEHPDGDGPMVINAADFNPRIHQRWSEAEAVAQAGGDPVQVRIAELERIYSDEGWGAIADLAGAVAVAKPAKGGWRSAIPLIAAAELGG